MELEKCNNSRDTFLTPEASPLLSCPRPETARTCPGRRSCRSLFQEFVARKAPACLPGSGSSGSSVLSRRAPPPLWKSVLMSFCLNSFLSFSPSLPPSLIAPNFESNDSWKQLAPPFDSIDRSPLRSSESRGSTFRALRGPRLNRIYDLVRKRKSVPRESDVYYREEEREREGGGEGGHFCGA